MDEIRRLPTLRHDAVSKRRPHVAAWAEAETVLAADLGDGTDDPRATAPDLRSEARHVGVGPATGGLDH